MLKKEVDNLVNGYFRWLKNNTALKEIEDAIVITTPHLDRHNDFLEIVVCRSNSIIEPYKLSDDGWILADLEASGCMLTTPRKEKLLNQTLNGFGVDLERGEIFTSASKKNFAEKKHSLVQAMLAVNDLFCVATPHIKSFFREDVENWLTENCVRFTSELKITGKTGYNHNFNFVIPSSKTYPERLLTAINNPNKSNIMNFIMVWEDLAITRKNDTQAYAILNDNTSNISENELEALKEYNITPVPWSNCHDALEKFVD